MQPALPVYRELAAETSVVPCWMRVALDQETPVTLFRKLVGGGPGFLLESLAGGEDAGRFSIVGAYPLRTMRSGSSATVVQGPGGGRILPADPFAALRAFVPSGTVPEGLRFAGGAVGYLGYDAVRYLEPLPAMPSDLDLPTGWFMECGLLAVVDHLYHELTLVAPTRPLAGGDPDLAYEDARDRLMTALRRLAAGVGGGRPIPLDDPAAGAAGPGMSWEPAAVANLDRDAFIAAVRRAKARIEAGDVQQVVVSRRLEFPLPGDPFDVYRAYRVVSPSPYMFFLRFDTDTALLGASPELLVRVEGRRVLTRPLAGTRPRGDTAAADLALERELLADEKERAEHGMLVDLGRDDLEKVSVPGSVRVERSMYVERYSHVMHLASDVVGELAQGRDAVDALAACFPAGTLSGAPKGRAMEIIAELEPVARGPYGGVVGYLGYDGDLDMCITIRTVVAHRGRAYLQVGAGIVAGSDPAAEFVETENKARSALRALALASRIGAAAWEAVPGGVAAPPPTAPAASGRLASDRDATWGEMA